MHEVIQEIPPISQQIIMRLKNPDSGKNSLTEWSKLGMLSALLIFQKIPKKNNRRW